MIPIFTDPKVLAWPNHLYPRTKDRAEYYPLADMLTTSFDCDAHFSQYSHPEIPRRLNSDAIGHEEIPLGVRMALLVLDVDCPAAHATGNAASEEWRASERSKVNDLFRAQPGGYYYETKKGYRLVYQTERYLRSEDDKELWREFYFRVCCLLASRYQIICDPACSDWTRLFRCPHATRDGNEAAEDRPAIGDPSNVKLWRGLEPADEQLSEEACLAVADLQNPERNKFHGWWKIQRHFLPQKKMIANLSLVAQPPIDSALVAVVPVVTLAPQAPTQDAPTPINKGLVTLTRAYAVQALYREMEVLKRATAGSRTSALTSASLCLFGLAKAGAIPRYQVEQAIHQACVENRYTTDYSQQDLARQLGNFWEMAEARDLRHVGRAAPEDLDRPEGEGDFGVDLLRGPKGALLSGIANVKKIAQQDPALKGLFALDTFSSQVRFQRDFENRLAGDSVGRDTVTNFRCYCTEQHGVIAGKSDAEESIYSVAKDYQYSEAERWFEQLPPWDGRSRLLSWLTTYLGAEDSPYTRLVGHWWLLQAVARVYVPGDQCDGTLILEGPLQGEGKSSLAFCLVPQSTWACDQPLNVTEAKNTAEIIQGKLIVEISELSAFKKADIETVKAFLTQRADDFRPPWELVARPHPRQCVFLGTTNDERYLRDPTGARRFWPVLIKQLDRVALLRDRDQLWAEARALYLTGAKWYPETQEQKDLLAGVTSTRQVQEVALGELIEIWLRKDAPPQVSLLDVLKGALEILPSRIDRPLEMRVAQVLKDLGWRRSSNQVKHHDGRARVYTPPENW